MTQQKIALVTGGSRGLGRNMALHLADHGVDSILTYREKAGEAREVVAAVQAKGRKAVALPLDVGDSRTFAAFAESVRRLKTGHGLGTPSGTVALADAEATLRRLRERQAEDAAAEQAYEDFDDAAKPAGIAEKLESAGFGKRTRPTAEQVLERLKRKAAVPAPAM